MDLMLTDSQIEEFDRNGIIVIENVLSLEEIEIARNGLHDQLLETGVNHFDVLAGKQHIDSGVRNKSKASHFFYHKWKMDVHLNEKIYKYMKQLNTKFFMDTPFGYFDDVIAFVDKVCWRLPDCIMKEGGLNLHIDRNPIDPYLTSNSDISNTKLSRWRPIQALLSLTDSYGSDGGGIKVVKGFHKTIDDFFSKDPTIYDEIGGMTGEFFRMGSRKYYAIQNKCHPIDVPAGSLVCWDNRLPHSTCNNLGGNDTRECVYIGFIPNVELNKKYCQEQFDHIKKNILPPIYFDCKNKDNNAGDRNWDIDELSDSQKHMLGLC